MWTKDPAAERLSSIQAYTDDPEVRRESWRQRAAHPVWSARPGPAHDALVTLERSGKLVALLTQNIDELHQAAGSSPERVVELHGTMHHVVCLSCGMRAPMSEALRRVEAGEDDPPCVECGGILKSATISFGQALDTRVILTAHAAAQTCDVLDVAGLTRGGGLGRGGRRRRGGHRDRQRRADAVRPHRDRGAPWRYGRPPSSDRGRSGRPLTTEHHGPR